MTQETGGRVTSRKVLAVVVLAVALVGCNGKSHPKPTGPVEVCWRDKPTSKPIHLSDPVMAKYLGYQPAPCP